MDNKKFMIGILCMYGVFLLSMDITYKVYLKKKLKKDEQNFLQIFAYKAFDTMNEKEN